MTNSNSSDRLDRIESLLESFIAASASDRQASSDRMTRIEQRLEQSQAASDERMNRLEETMTANHHSSNERMTRVEEGLERIEKVVESNNRFLESFSADLKGYTDSMNNMATRMDGVIATANQDRQETNSRLAAIQRQVGAMPAPSATGGQSLCAAIARHLGVI